MADPSPWFLPMSERSRLGIAMLAGNDVSAFIEYRDYYKALATEIAKTTSSDHFIYFADWQLVLDTWMDGPSGRVTFRQLLQDASSRGVQIRALLYSGQSLNDPVHNDAAAKWINALPTGAAFLDDRYLYFGSHHQKMVIVGKGTSAGDNSGGDGSGAGVVGFCGGMDIAEDRQLRDGGPHPPISGQPKAWHDVQLRIAGPAVMRLWQTFNSRWVDFSYADASGPHPALKTPPFPSNLNGKKQVQVVRTFGNGTRHGGLSAVYSSAPSTYSFAPAGEMTIYKLLCQAIKNTTRTIYLEDQYLVESEAMGSNPAIPAVLADTLAKDSFKQMIILVPGAGSLQGELYQVWRRRTKFWGLLGAAAPSKVKIYQYKALPESPYLVHSKTWIFDDTFTLVSSANCNRRSYSHDSEIGAGVLDPDASGTNFSKDLRVQLWLKHLNAKGPTRSASDVDDFVAAAPLWDTTGTALEPLDLVHPANMPPDHHLGGVTPAWAAKYLNSWDNEWDDIIDPDGS